MAKVSQISRRENLGTDEKRQSQSDLLVELSTDAELFHTPDGDTAYVTVAVDGHFGTYRVGSRAFRRWLILSFFRMHGKSPSAQPLADALGTLEAKALFDGAEHKVFMRVGSNDLGTVYLDLGNSAWEAVEINPQRWRVVNCPAVKFLRPPGMRSLPYPVSGGSLDELDAFLNLRQPGDKVLTKAWLVGALRPRGPYPVGVFHGPKGCAKSTGTKVLKALIDPNTASLRSLPRDERDAMIFASHAWVMAFDNLSFLPPWLSDVFCRLASGGGFRTRQLYSDQDEVLFEAQRPILLNGIEETVTRADLLDRSLIMDLEEIPDECRRDEEGFWREFDSAHPRILGALLDAVSAALRNGPGVKLPRLPRMADFAIWVTAAEPALGWPGGTFLDAYGENRDAGNELALEASAFAGEVRRFVEGFVDGEEWMGSATELLSALNKAAPYDLQRHRGWPKDGRGLSNRLRRVAPNLGGVGVQITFGRDAGGKRPRWICLQKVSAKDRPSTSLRPETPRDGDDNAAPQGRSRDEARDDNRSDAGHEARPSNRGAGTKGTMRDDVSSTFTGDAPVPRAEAPRKPDDPGATDRAFTWPPECLEAERKWGRRHARLFPLLEETVSTPKGQGQLIQVSAERAGVILDRHPGVVTFLDPELISPKPDGTL